MHYTEFDNMLASVSHRAADASESHGTLIGLFSAKPETAVTEWAAALVSDAGDTNVVPGDDLREAAGRLVGLLSDGDMGFELLLPDDDVALPDRVRALARWCQGYLYGLAQGGIRQFEGLPGDCAEILEDLVELTKAEASDESEAGERDFFELSEYVRVGAQLVYEELRELADSAASQKH